MLIAYTLRALTYYYVTQSGISPKIGKTAYELLYRDSSKHTITYKTLR